MKRMTHWKRLHGDCCWAVTAIWSIKRADECAEIVISQHSEARAENDLILPQPCTAVRW
jgi:hypothetical protein